ncbi:hypothetical protein BGW80DRAFT_1487984 [Lactifluus volemus]|nr:hypothetical protein BGW80DRAFT_1487984 [Lactifluus volemus]
MHRLFKLLSILSLLFGARVSFLTAHLLAPHPLDVRQVSNACANNNEQFIFPDISAVTVAFTIDTCPCVEPEDIPTYIRETVPQNVLQVFTQNTARSRAEMTKASL